LRIKALIFDVDGTLADTEEAHRHAFNQAFEEHGLGWYWSKPVYARWLEVTGGKERLAAFLDSLALEASEHEAQSRRIPAIHRTKTSLYAGLIRDGRVPLRQGIARLIEDAGSAGVSLAIASTTTRENIDALLCTHFGELALERFSVIGAADAVLRKKPAPDIYEYVLRELRESAADCIAIEDSALGLAAAKGAGLFTVITPSEWTRREDFSGADLLLTSFESCDRPLLELEYAFSTNALAAVRFGVNRKWGG